MQRSHRPLGAAPFDTLNAFGPARLRAKWLAREARLVPLGRNAHAQSKYGETDALQPSLGAPERWGLYQRFGFFIRSMVLSSSSYGFWWLGFGR